MKAWKGLLLAACGTALMLGNATAQAQSFTDVKRSHWAESSITFLTEREIIFGYEDGSYGVNDNITRAQAASMIMRYFGWGDLSGQEDPGYPDVKPGHWAYNEIAALHSLGIFRPEGSYQPNLAVTRAEMADMLVKTFSLSSITAVKFTDLSRDHWAYRSINILAGKGVTSGYPDGSFRPDANVTRAEFAVLMSSLMKETYSTARPGYEGAIYDLEIGGQVYQLDEPLLLTERWLAPVELFEKLGYYIESHDAGALTMTTTDGRTIHLHEGQQEVWVGDTSVAVDRPLEQIDGSFYIAAHGLLSALEKPLVFYPDQFLIRLEAPRITAADINKRMPEAALDVIHPKQPFWHWAKRDRDYLELIRRDGLAGKEAKLLDEMEQLTSAYFATEREKRVVRGLNYYSDNVTGKLDAISRGLEARYELLHGAEDYAYPAVGTSGAVGVFDYGRFEFDYIVQDHLFDHYEDNKQQLLDALTTNELQLPLEHFQGLNVHAIPFFIRERAADGSIHAWAGIASGSTDMLVVNSGLGTFVHELGHNWDSKYGDHDAYLDVRGQAGYAPPSSEWADRVGENFAEDFAAAFLSEQYGALHKGAFGQPTDEQLARIKRFIQARTPAAVSDASYPLTVNGANLLPDVMLAADGRLHVEGQSGHSLAGTVKHKATGVVSTTDFPSNARIDQVIQLPQQGLYEVTIGGKSMIVVYP